MHQTYRTKNIVIRWGFYKLNKLISELSEVESVNVFPSCGDESNVFGHHFYSLTN